MKDQNAPSLITVIIPTRNEGIYIDRCLRSVFSADAVSGGMEILVVDGMSTDDTRTILQDWCRREQRLKLLDNPSGIVPSAMNIGIRASRGEWIIRLDAHSEYPTDYFTRCLRVSQATLADNVGGSVVSVGLDETLQGRIVRALTTHWFGVGNSAPRVKNAEGWADTVPFGCYRRSVFEHIGLYDERLVRNQDYELNRRLIKAGGRIWYDPAIRIFYYNRSSLYRLLCQAFATGKWNPWMWSVAPYSFASRHAIPLVFVAALTIAIALFFVNFTLGTLVCAIVLIPYFLLAWAASFSQAARFGFSLLFVLPLLFFTYHIAYGAGSLWGLLLLLIKRTPFQRGSFSSSFEFAKTSSIKD